LKYEPYTHINPDHFRPGENIPLCGNSNKAQELLGWKPSVTFKDVVREMVLSDIKRLKEMQK
jgi:GDPmannose 4,6-dehydratase